MIVNNPWSVHIELTEGCNRRCKFCGIHSLYREKEDMIYKYMTVDTAKNMAIDLNQWLGKVRIEFAMQGEPLLNPNAFKIFNLFRTFFPKAQLMVTSNMDPVRHGKKFNHDLIKKLFVSGINLVLADYYLPNSISYDEFYVGLKNNSLGVEVSDYFKDKPQVWMYQSPTMQKIVVMDNTENRDWKRSMNNQAGNLDPKFVESEGFKIGKLPHNKRCHHPFREMAIKYDGSVAICCMDWQREGLIGQFPEQHYKQIWESQQMNWVRKMLIEGRRDLLSPCDRCNYHANKVGLCKDPYGDQKVIPEVVDVAKKFHSHQKIMIEKKIVNKYVGKPFQYK